ncbi:hypothetical protein P3X46_019262 [Hevea brasiliensis]|uniref:MYB-CC type transcription factor LHEQLE-containing domain-containing protein n=2 Tax=Hevea brasiliensis TaxID=3981 RepID=A0ABQ9LI80_HEVBR|nr:hypothetical protein P3X46_019262 [Hevea brasiliensis]
MGQSQFVEEASFKLKHQSLLQDFLELQKEFVSKKKKLQMTKLKRDVLSAEVRFLRQRHRHLMAIKSLNLQPEQDPIPPQKSSMQNEGVGKLLRAEKKLKNGIITEKRVKKKISWQDHSTVMKV